MDVQKWLDDRLAFFEHERKYLEIRIGMVRNNGAPSELGETYAKLLENDECMDMIKKLKKVAADAGLGALEESK